MSWIKPPPGTRLDLLDPYARWLVAGYLMNDGRGSSKVEDISGNGNHGALTNMDPKTDWVGGPNGWALDFDGNNDWIDLGTVNSGHSLMLAGSGGTISVRFKQESTGDDFQRLIDKSDAGNFVNGWALYTDNQGYNPGERRIALGRDGRAEYSPASIYNFDEWVCAIATWEDAQEASFSVNGVEYAVDISLGGDPVTIPDVSTEIKIGTWNHTTGREFNGQISHVLVFNKALSVTERMNLYKMFS